jgi:ATP-dependent helicase HepA
VLLIPPSFLRSEQALNSLEGLILHSKQFGYCKVVRQRGRQAEVRFCGTGRDAIYTLDALLRGKDFQWQALPTGMRCKVKSRGECIIIKAPLGPDERSQIHEYTVEFENESRESARLTERELWPIAASLTETAQTRLASLRMDPWPHFRARDGLLSALARLYRDTSGIHALAASRIDLLAHQASVIRTVLGDARLRYILADEVGLGKTVEAGVVLHQLLTQQPKSRVLVLTPGALTRQWLSEMRLSFGDREFKLADLHPTHSVDWSSWSRVICSLKLAAGDHRQQVLAQTWSLVIVDEAHNLLWNPIQYSFVQALSDKVDGILLLSAVPARERAGELLRLLQLIDSKTYANGSAVAQRFEELYQAQTDIGRRLRILQSRQVSTSSSATDVQQAAQRLAKTPVLAGDAEIQWILAALMSKREREEVLQGSARLMNVVATKYRVSRRILKNRRSQLLDQDLLASVERKRQIAWYTPGRLELGAHDAMAILFNRLQDAGAPADALQIVFRKAVAAMCDPVALMDIASALREGEECAGPALPDFDSAALLDYDEHTRILASASAALAPFVDRALVDDFHTYASTWLEHESVPKRIEALIDAINDLVEQDVQKLIVFAGTMGSAELVVEELQRVYGSDSVVQFRFDLNDDFKEDQVIRFRRDDTCRILVSDESGGEGRNFQFAAAVVHFDLPWSVAAVEQRIGRLDRIGRREPVLSVVIAAQSTLEAAWVECLDRGFDVFKRSISGLEFMLRETEHKVVDHVIRDGPGGIDAKIDEVHDISQMERASDDADALTDLVSFDRGQRLSASEAHAAEARIEEAFPRYMRSIGVGQVARQIADNRDPNLKIWRLKPEDVTQVELPGIHRNASGQIGDRYGTFQRKVARDRPDLDFFTAGHALFDSVCSVAMAHITGRTFAIKFDSADLPTGQYLLTTWSVKAVASGTPQTFLGRAQKHLSGRRIRLLLSIHDAEVLDQESVRRLETRLLLEEATVSDLRDQLTTVLEGSLEGWPELADRLMVSARDSALRVNRDVFSEEDQDFQHVLDREIERLRQDGREDSTQLVEALAASREAINSPQVELDSAGIILVTSASHVTPALS